MHREFQGEGMAASLCILQESVCVFLGARIVRNNKHRCHSNTDDVPSLLPALAESIRVHTSLLDVRSAVEGSSCESCEDHEQSEHVMHLMSCTHSITVRALVRLALASFPAHSY